MKILHCVHDDKFMNGAIELFNMDNRHTNDYVYVNDSNYSGSFDYIKNPYVKTVSIQEFIDMAKNYNLVVLHSWRSLKQRVIVKIPESCKVLWLGWGFDIYNPLVVDSPLYGCETLEFCKNNKLIYNRSWKDQLRFYFNKSFINHALARVDYFSGVYPYECDLIKKYKPSFRAINVDFYYGSVDFFIKKDFNRDVKHGKVDIILGNSANPTNNHHEALTLLKAVGIAENAKIIIPLSYNGTLEYRGWVKDYANELFPGQIKALDSYMPFDEYINLVSNCRVAIYPHKRQQASDNIFMQIMYGAKVYLSEDSLALNYLKSLGLHVFSLESELCNITDELTDKQVLENRKILSSIYYSESMVERIVKMNDIIENKTK